MPTGPLNIEMISRNFTTLKALSILIIVSGHFFRGTFLWIPATFGLLIFAHSSAYFTALKYKNSFSIQRYWLQKIYRLGVNLFVINLFLLWLFILESKNGIWTWQTIVGLFGMSGFLNWLRLPNPSPFGAGVWFLTLLLLFYAIYPLLDKLFKRRWFVIFVFFSSAIFLNWLNSKIAVGHALWSTIFAFIYGFAIARTDLRLPKKITIPVTFILVILIILLNYYLKIKTFNFILLISVFCFFMLWVEYLPLPERFSVFGKFLSKYIFEIYLIHTYLFLKLTGIQSIDFLSSLILIGSISIVLARISATMKKYLFTQDIQSPKIN